MKRGDKMELNHCSPEHRNQFIESNKGFIYTATHKICKRSLAWENDDELSIALIAFNRACDSYKENKGNFYSYAKTLIRNALIDYFRKKEKVPYLIFDDTEEKTDYIDFKTSMNDFEIAKENENRIDEIKLFSEELCKYNIDFSILVKHSPSHKDTRNKLLNLAIQCINNKSILALLKEKKKLPVKHVMLLSEYNRRFIEKWRKYLLTIILILSSDEYPYIKSYLNIKVGEHNE